MTDFTELKTKKDRRAFIREKLTNDRRWAIRGLMVIYQAQTEDEKLTGHTREANGVGFTAFDDEILTSFAEQWMSKKFLSEKQIAFLHRKMPKYTNQIERQAQ